MTPSGSCYANTLNEPETGMNMEDTFVLSGHTQGRRTSSVQFATNGLCAQITSGSNTHLILDQLKITVTLT